MHALRNMNMIAKNIDLESSFVCYFGVRTSCCFAIDLHMIFQTITLDMLFLLFLYIVYTFYYHYDVEKRRSKSNYQGYMGLGPHKQKFFLIKCLSVFERPKFLLILFIKLSGKNISVIQFVF